MNTHDAPRASRILNRWIPPGGPSTQQGAALLVVLLLTTLITLSALIFAMGARTELKVASNDLLGRQALSIAEGGISHAIVLVTNDAADGLGMDEALGNNPTGGLVALGSEESITEDGVAYNFRCTTMAGTTDSRYCVRAYDNFDETLGSADVPGDDIDDTIILRSRGTIASATRIVETMIGVSVGPECALITEGNLQIPGNPVISGSKGCVHTNSQLQIGGNPNISKGATATSPVMDISGSPVLEGVSLVTNTLKDQYESTHRSQPALPIPSVRPMKFGPTEIRLHEQIMALPNGFRLDADQNVYVGPGYTGAGGAGSAWVCVESPANCTGGRALDGTQKAAIHLDAWKHEDRNWGGNAHNDQWVSDKDYVGSGVFFIEGSAVISKDWGTPGTPWRATIVATNSIQMPGKPIIAPYYQSTNPAGAGYVTSASPAAEWALRNALMVSGNDLEINGDAGSNNFAGGLFAHQQIKINGNPDIIGFLIAEDGKTTWPGDPAPNCNSDMDLLCDPYGNSVSGNPNITFNGLGTALYPGQIKRLRWNDIR